MRARAFCQRIGIGLPIVQAPVGGASTPELVAAVSGAGGLGVLSGTWREPSALAGMVDEIRHRTDAPFGVNFVLEWDMAERVAVCVDAGVRHFSFFWGDPAPYVELVHRAGGLVWSTVSSPRDVARRVDAGVDVLVAQGWEAGGHVEGSMSTMALVPRVVDLAEGIPVVAAGGIADGRGVAAALCLGASAAWIGTAFLVASEGSVHPSYRETLLTAEGDDTVHTSLFDGGWPDAPHRVLANADYREWVASGSPLPGTRPGEGDVVATDPEGDPVLRYSSHLPRPGGTGEVLRQALYSGQGVGLIRRVAPAREIVEQLVEEAVVANPSLAWMAGGS